MRPLLSAPPFPAAAALPAQLRAPIFIVGTERSGSNLLRTILDAHPAIAAPHPPHILHFFRPLAAAYGRLDDPVNFHALAGDVARLVRWHIHPWQPLPDGAALARAARAPSLTALVDALYHAHAAHRGRARWACKSTFNIGWVDDLRAFHPGARFLWLIRDPRAVAASNLRSVFGPSSARASARLWTVQQEQGWRAFHGGRSPDCRMILYESLVTEPERVIRDICAFLDEPFDAGMLAPHLGAAAQASARLTRCWSQLSSPISDAAAARFATDLSPRQIGEVEDAAGEVMGRFGYDRTTLAATHRALPDWADLLFRRVPRRFLIEARSLWRDRNGSARWRRALYLSMLRARRGLGAANAR